MSFSLRKNIKYILKHFLKVTFISKTEAIVFSPQENAEIF